MVELSEEVEKGIESYYDVLKLYDVPECRRTEKANEMRAFLLSLDNNTNGVTTTYRTCLYKTLGQRFGTDNKPLNKELKMVVYKDRKSKKKWSFSFVVDTINNIVFVLRMVYSPFVKDDSISRLDKPYKRIFDDVPMRKNVRYPVLTHILDCRSKHPELFY